MFFLPLLLALPLPANDPPVPAFDLGAPRRTVLFDQDEKGDLFALGRTYKMYFDSDGAHYVPKFGARAPKSLPLHFGFAPGSTKAIRSANRVVLDHGSFNEIYDLGPEFVEQSFEIEKRSQDGDLSFRIPLETELDALAADGDGIRFGRAGLGEVHYGDATIVDSAGNRVTTKPKRIAGAIEIVVSDGFLDHATFPITIDPVLSTIAIDTGTDDRKNPDVAYADPINTFVVVYEEVIAANDFDLVQRRYDVNGAFLDEVGIAIDNDSATDPAIAFAGGDFLTAWHNISSGVNADRIKARSRFSGNTTVGTAFNVSGSLENGEANPDVGGTTAGGIRPFLIAYEAFTALGGRNVLVVPTSASGNLGLTDGVFQFGDETEPSVSQQIGSSGVYMVAYSFEDDSILGTPENDIYAMTFDAAGAKLQTDIQINNTPAEIDSTPDVGGDGIDFLVAWNRNKSGQDDDILARRYQVAGNLTPLGAAFSLTDLDHVGGDNLDQFDPAVGYDGARFVVAYREGAIGAGNFDVFASSLFNAGSTTVLEKHVAIGTTTSPELEPAIVSCNIDQVGKHLIAWTRQISATNRDVNGALYSSLGSGSDAITVQTGCGSPEPALITSNQAVIGAEYSFIIGNTTNPLLLVGLPTSVPMCPGQGGCVLGVSPLVITPIPLFVNTTIPADAAILGATFALQVVDLLPANATGSLCGPPKYTQKFRVSDTRVTTIR